MGHGEHVGAYEMRVQRDTADFYDALSRWGKTLDEPNRERIEQTLGLVPADVRTVLDLGCGDGSISNPLLAKGLDVTGVDLSAVALGHFDGKGLVGSLDRLSFPDRSFDLVISAEVLEHLPVTVYETALKEIERVARRYVIVTTPNGEHLAAGFVRCEQCRCIYHRNLHVRVFDRAVHHSLFRELELDKTVEINSWRYYLRAAYLAQRLLGIYQFKEGLICPCCGHNGVERPRLGFLRKHLLRGIQLSAAVFTRRPKARWIASLHQRPTLNRQ